MIQIAEAQLIDDALEMPTDDCCTAAGCCGPADPPAPEPDDIVLPEGEVSTLTVVDLLLKGEPVLNRLLKVEARQRELLPKFMAIAIACFVLYGVVFTAVLNGFGWRNGQRLPHLPSLGNLTTAYTLGLIAANGICLPSFYFYGLLAGLRTTMLAIAAHALKGMASGGLALVGLLPVYLALALLPLVLPPGSVGIGLNLTLLGLLLPFLSGLRGAASLYTGITGLADTMAPARRAQRECLLRRMMLAWVGCYTFVTPVVIYSLWTLLTRWTG